jgi:putative MATE family efflux protein
MEINKTLQENKMGVMSEGRLLFTMAIPMVISMLVQALYNVVDSIFVARINEDAFTAVSMAFPIQTLMGAFTVGIRVGMSQLLSKSLGEKDYKRAGSAAAHGVLLSFITCAVFIFFGLFFSETFFTLQKVSNGIAVQGRNYMFITTVFSIGLFIQFIFEGILMSTGRTFFPMISQIIGALLNTMLDPLLIFGLFGFPALGVYGAAIATIFSQWTAAALALLFHLQVNREIRFKRGYFKLQADTIKRILTVGSSAIIKQGSGAVTIVCLNSILLGFTSSATAVYGAFHRLYVLFLTPVWAFANVLIVLVAYNLGTVNKERVIKFSRLSLYYGLGLTALGTLLIGVFPGRFLALFGAKGDMMLIGVAALPILCIFLPFQGCSTIIIAVLQGLGEGKAALIAGLCERLLFPLAAAFLFAMTKVLAMVWWSFTAGEVLGLLTCVLLLWNVYKKKLRALG